MKKVLILGPLPPPYMGPAVATEIILHSRLKSNFDLIHLNTNTHKTIATFGVWNWSRFQKNAKIYLKMLFLLVRYWPRIVLIPISQTTSGFIKDSIFVLISRLFRRKTILQLRGSNFKKWLSGSSELTCRYIGFILRRTQGMIVMGKKLTGLFADYYPPEKIFVVPNGANLNIPFVKRRGKSLRILYLSNLQPSKGIDDVLDAIAICHRKHAEFGIELDVVGSWSDEETKGRCLKMAEETKLPIHFHPPSIGSDKNEYLANADLFVFPPREPEGHPWVIVEAMAAGLPIISTDQGAITESVIDGVNGFIVQARAPEVLAEKMIALITNPELRLRMATESRRLYKENFTEEKMVERLTHVFNQIMDC